MYELFIIFLTIVFVSQICFWLLDNGFRVMIAACDTFRAGAVEQLRTHVRHLNALHPPAGGSGPASVLLYEKGYGKDAAAIAMDAINFGELQKVVFCQIVTPSEVRQRDLGHMFFLLKMAWVLTLKVMFFLPP